MQNAIVKPYIEYVQPCNVCQVRDTNANLVITATDGFLALYNLTLLNCTDVLCSRPPLAVFERRFELKGSPHKPLRQSDWPSKASVMLI